MITQLKIAVHRLKELKGFVMPGDISKVTPLAYNDYLSQRRAELIADKTLSDWELKRRLFLLFVLQRYAERQINIIRSHIVEATTKGTPTTKLA